MADLSWVSFEQALSDTNEQRRHLLTGNGFSVGGYSGFRYESLMAHASEREPAAAELLAELRAVDFEDAIRRADPAQRVLLRECFIRTIMAIHPTHRELSNDSREQCALFLSQFLREKKSTLRGIIFTTNYDLMIYWIIVKFSKLLNCWDGFDGRTSEWEISHTSTANILYLHGCLPIFERPARGGPLMVKERADPSPDGRRLSDKIRDQLAANKFPVFVSEGTGMQKRARIRDNDYLSLALKKFQQVCRDPKAALFVIGHSLAAVDDHITDIIGISSGPVYIGLYSDRDHPRARELSDRWARSRLAARQPALQVQFFDSSWRSP